MNSTGSAAQNEETARRMMAYDRTVALLRCGVSDASMERLASVLRSDGWYVYEVSEEQFRSMRGEQIGGITVVCDGAGLPESLSAAVERYHNENGRLFFFGGPLFGARDITKQTMCLEGVSPLYKTYQVEDCSEFETLPQPITAARLTGHTDRVICPSARPDGAGFGMNRRCRILPTVSVIKTGGRDGGRRGAAAYFVLSDTIGRMSCTIGTRIGNVSPVTQGSAAAVIGIPLDDVLTMGGEPLISDMMRGLGTGQFLFEAGTEKYVNRPEAEIRVGARILSVTRDYLRAEVRFRLNGVEKTCSCVTVGQNYTTVRTSFAGLPEGAYRLETALIFDGRVIDSVKEEFFVSAGRHTSDPAEFIRVEGGNFKLHGENWYMYGINYFPLYQVSLEQNDYWRGTFDKSNYIASEVEKDLAHIRAHGLNTVAVRVDSNAFENVIDPLRDFFCRCARLGLKVMLSYCNITNPMSFSEAGFAELMRLLDIADDPTLFSYDIFWECGAVFTADIHAGRWAGAWRAWLTDTYGDLESAEQSIGALDRTPAGQITCPPRRDFEHPDPKLRAKMTAYFRFLSDMASRKWNDAVTAMKKYDSHHLFSNRVGNFLESCPNVFLSAVAKHMDFMCLEAYSFTLDEIGFYASAALDRAAHYVSGGKPVTWVEYGISLPGLSGQAVGTRLLWDGERNAPLDERVLEQRKCQAQFNELFRFCGAKGSLPWFYAGGFRFTEHSDCGYTAPDGSDRPAFTEYASIGEWFMRSRREKPVESVEADPEGEYSNWCRIFFGEGTFNKFARDRAALNDGQPLADDRVPGIGIRAAKRAYESGGLFEFVTKGTGTTSENTPLVLCGDAVYTGKGPLKYLDAEFNFVRFRAGENVYVPQNGQVTLPAGRYTVEAGVGNLAAAKWLAGETFGCVVVRCGSAVLRLNGDVPYLADGVASGTVGIDRSGTAAFRAAAVGRAEFGEVYRVRINLKT